MAIDEAVADAYMDGYIRGTTGRPGFDDPLDLIRTGDEVTDGTDRFVYMDGLFILIGKTPGCAEAYGEADFPKDKPLRKTGRSFTEVAQAVGAIRARSVELQREV